MDSEMIKCNNVRILLYTTYRILVFIFLVSLYYLHRYLIFILVHQMDMRASRGSQNSQVLKSTAISWTNPQWSLLYQFMVKITLFYSIGKKTVRLPSSLRFCLQVHTKSQLFLRSNEGKMKPTDTECEKLNTLHDLIALYHFLTAITWRNCFLYDFIGLSHGWEGILDHSPHSSSATHYTPLHSSPLCKLTHIREIEGKKLRMWPGDLCTKGDERSKQGKAKGNTRWGWIRATLTWVVQCSSDEKNWAAALNSGQE